jgi:hypothetical protein
MGHLTALAANVEDAVAHVLAARDAVQRRPAAENIKQTV